ncbi:hypothetical protein BBK36DRAFT_1111428 [Trichoderma citrinoviride]|uniref:Uncharacterized protein n=1 Tax=Trichoderma citrinoviride TaxID=58853 RepID=A0A2T4BK84_9HYPO|nr:hypothetical protein BBK36DRAFT_1111428 [Trichoderma citrinoviride]PTB69718.1 hypothetical protein BBK36DRAFT_1111428 [Trichoderma citrinoviride]
MDPEINNDQISDDEIDNEELVDADYDSDLEDTSISIGLNKTGERGSGYHTRNDPTNKYQRQTVTERRGIIEVRCKSRDVIHGILSEETGQNATLLVYDFYLDTTRKSRRIVSASLEFEFGSSVPGAPAPQVQAIAPAGRITLLQSTQEESVKRAVDVNAGVSEFGANAGGTVSWEKTVSRTTSDDARVTGHIFSDDYGKGVGASWTIHENSTIKSGTPSFLRCAILLNRGFDDNQFQCKVRIRVEADWKSEMGRLFGSTPPDDPVLFDPDMPPTNKLRKYDTENLGSIDLDEFVDIVFDKQLKKKKESS